ncbi:hypothetical protein [Nocardiopsis sp. NPDC057823]|uniref:hypothetical protein n=1 Tax=Nocardiopsis sp. NPDC057823 TaxID=3346256 RepID=UPI00366E7F6E
MIIRNTTHEARHPWPEDILLQGGTSGIVFRDEADGGPYRTAFVEAFPGTAFLRGQGATVADAEDACWKQFLVWRDCDGSGQGHGPYEARGYTNGAGFCAKCGIWESRVLPVQPDPPDRKPTLFERALSGDEEALDRIFGTRARDLPEGPGDGETR